MKTIARLMCILVSGFNLLTPAQLAHANPPPQRVPSFRSSACEIVLNNAMPANAEEGTDIECGYLTVLEQHDQPNGPALTLAVVIVKSTGTNPAPDPLVMLQGGPGGSTIDYFTQVLFGPNALSHLRADRDIILFDQRGTLFAQPALTCPELMRLTEDTMEERLDPDTAQQMYVNASIQCRDRLERSGTNLSAYDSVENAHDIESLREALGYEQINLYGVSYGTLLALHTMREHPNSLRAVVLDAVVPTQLNFLETVAQSQERAFEALFQACATDADCNRHYPNLEQVFFDLVAQWKQTPVVIPLTNNTVNPAKTYQTVFDGEALMSVLFQFMYSSEILPGLPKMIYDARAGDYALIEAIYPQIVFDDTFSPGMYNSVICAEDSDFTVEQLDLNGVRPEIAQSQERSAKYFLELCQQWKVEALPASVDDPVVSDIPTLVYSGQFDPITPPSNGELVAQTLKNSYAFTFLTTAHGAAPSSECAAEMMQAFLNNPLQAPDSTCIKDKPAVTFFSPSTIVVNGMLLRLLTKPGLLDGILALMLCACLLALSSPIVAWPIMGLVRLANRRPSPSVDPTTGERARQPNVVLQWLARLCALGVSGLSLVFFISYIIIGVYLIANNDFVLFFGFPNWTRLLFVLPVLITLLTLTMGLLMLWRWFSGAGSVWARLYYSVLTLSAVGVVIVLGVWGFLTALI